MKLIVVMITACFMQVSASTFGQYITMSKKNASIQDVLKIVKQQSGYDVLYKDEVLANTKKVSLSLVNVPLADALDKILENQLLTYTIREKTIVIKPKDPTFLERVVATLIGIDVSGRIVDADGRGLPGASVSVKGKGKAVSTGVNGSFLLKGVDEGAVLVVSFIGYVSKEVKASTNLGDVVLELSTSKLDEVQVIAYGTTTQRLSTGNVTTIKADVIEKQPVNNPLLALQGRVPGLFIEQATGFAGTGVTARIQGKNSTGIYSRNDPLYVVDGIPYMSQLIDEGNYILGNSGTAGTYGSPLNFINPENIESIDILKDADATAIYGSRAANGAILITTKKGKSGDSKIDLNLQSGWGKVPRKLKLMDSQQYLEMRLEAMKNDGIINPSPGPNGDSDLNGNWDNSHNTDWQKELLGKTANYNDINVSVSGGSERTTFLIGAGYHKEGNVFPGKFNDQKTSLHFNINNTSLNRKFNIQFSGSYLYDNNEMPAIDLTEKAVTLAPVAPSLFMEDGSINWQADEAGNSTFLVNPIGYLYDSFSAKANNLIANMILSYEIIPGLTLKTNLGYINFSSTSVNKALLESTPPEYQQYISRSTLFGDVKTYSWTIEPQITYSKKIGDGKLEFLLGSTLLKNSNNSSRIIALGFSNDLVMDDIMSAPTVNAKGTLNSIYKYNALFGRINYNWQDKYIVNLTGRRDGSSRFGPKSQFHNFGAIGAAWLFSNEKIIKEHLSFLSFGKFRGSFGTTGSDQINDYQFLSLYTPVAQDIPYQGVPVYQPNGLTNPYLQWEETKKLQLGLDLGLFEERLLLNANYYTNHSSNQLQSYSLPWTTGFSFITRNQAYKIRNSGWELSATNVNLKLKDFTWSTSGNITLPKTLLVDYPDKENSSSTDFIVGKALSTTHLYHFLGVDPVNGTYQFEDKNGNPTSSPNPQTDKNILLDLAPKFYGGFLNTFIWKKIQFDFLFSFVKQYAPNYSFGSANPGSFNSGIQNEPSSLLSRWQKPGDVTNIQKFTTTRALRQSFTDLSQSDAVITDASYIRLKNVSFSWQLPSGWQQRIHLQNCNLFVQGQNLLTISGYTGLDPETKSSLSLPPLRVITLGIKASL